MSALASTFTLDNTGFIAKMVENATVTEREAKRMQRSLQYITDQLKVNQRATQVAANAASDFKQASAHVEQFGFHTAAAKRELLVLAHELSQGNYKRFGGSLLVLGEQTGAATLLFSGLGIAALGAGAGVLGAAVAFHKGAQESEALRNSLMLTGNFAGLTEGQFNTMARSIANETTHSVAKAREALQALVSTGEIGPRVIGPLANAVVLYAKATHETEEKVGADFAKMNDGVAKWAVEHNRSMNFISLAQYEYIRRLEEQGRKEEAELAVSKALTDHLAGALKPTLGLLERAWKAVGQAADSTWDAMKGVGRTEATQDKLVAARKELEKIGVNGRIHSPDSEIAVQGRGRTRTYGDLRASQRAFIAGLESQVVAENNLSAATAKRLAVQKAGIEGSKFLEQLDHERKGANRLKRDLEELHASIAAKRAAGGTVSSTEAAAQEAFIRQRDRSAQDKTGENEAKKLATYLRDRLTLYSQETAKLAEQAAQYTKYGHTLEKLALDLALVDIASGKAANAGYRMKAELLAAAVAQDEQARKMNEAKAAAEEAAKATKAREAEYASLVKTLATSAAATQDQIDRMRVETELLGSNTVQRKIAIEQLRIEDAARKELQAHPNDFMLITGSADKQKVAIADAIAAADRAKQAFDDSRNTFSQGAEAAFKKYADDAANASRYAEQAIGGGLKHAEDALVNFAKTGRLSFSSLWQFMADEFLRQQARMLMVQATQGGGGAGLVGSLAGAFFSGNTGAATGVANAMPGNSLDNLIGITGAFGTSHANGLDYVPYDGYPAILHKGERVQTAVEARGGKSTGGATTFDYSGQTINVGQGVSRGEVAAAVNQSAAQTEMRMRRLMRQGSI